MRVAALHKLKREMQARETILLDALYADLHKSHAEGYMCELGLNLDELGYLARKLPQWAKPQRHPTPLAQFYSSSYQLAEPYGVVLVMSPWNYPYLLSLDPLFGAIAAGNCVVLKPSAYAPNTSRAMAELIAAVFPPDWVTVIQGGREQNAALLEQKFDYIFFTGSVAVGKLVMARAAEHLTPVTLELGGKSPCIVERSANLHVAARRIAFGKWLNVGQTCVAPDYVLVDREIKDELIGLIREECENMYGSDALASPAFGKMVNRKHFDRVMGLIDPTKVVMGGHGNERTLRIEPTIMDNVTPADAVMGQEIFGPVLPVMAYDGLEEALRFVEERPTPLALYLFTARHALARRVMREVPFGGGCVNDTIMHLATSRMGFGGMGASGMGSYHGRKSFEAFTHEKSIVDKATWFDAPFRYQPYAAWKRFFVRKFVH